MYSWVSLSFLKIRPRNLLFYFVCVLCTLHVIMEITGFNVTPFLFVLLCPIDSLFCYAGSVFGKSEVLSLPSHLYHLHWLFHYNVHSIIFRIRHPGFIRFCLTLELYLSIKYTTLPQCSCIYSPACYCCSTVNATTYKTTRIVLDTGMVISLSDNYFFPYLPTSGMPACRFALYLGSFHCHLNHVL